MNPSTPSLSIGLPVYNGEEFLEHTLQSLMGQTFRDFELIISDNASDDGTEEICRRHAAGDSRVRYVRQSKNRGAVFNWNFVAKEARGRYFKWASANDYYDPRFLEACLSVLRNQSDVVLCYARTRRVTDDNQLLDIDTHDMAVPNANPAKRYITMMYHFGRLNVLSGVVRSDALLATGLERNYPHGDHVLMAELALHGKFFLVDEVLFYRRWGEKTASTSSMNQSELRKFLTGDNPRSRQLDFWTKQFDFLKTVLRSSLSPGQKFQVTLALARQCVRRRQTLWRELMTLFQHR